MGPQSDNKDLQSSVQAKPSAHSNHQASRTPSVALGLVAPKCSAKVNVDQVILSTLRARHVMKMWMGDMALDV